MLFFQSQLIGLLNKVALYFLPTTLPTIDTLPKLFRTKYFIVCYSKTKNLNSIKYEEINIPDPLDGCNILQLFG